MALGGAALVAIGAFSPVLSAPFEGSISYFNNGNGDGTVALVLSAVVVLAVFINKARWLWIDGLIIGGMVTYDLVNVTNRIHKLTGLAANLVQLEWGWALLYVGAGLIFLASLLPRE